MILAVCLLCRGDEMDRAVLVRLSQRKILDEIREIFANCGFGQELQIVDRLSDRESDLRCVDHSAERNSFALAPGCFDQQVFILRKQNAANLHCPIEQVSILQAIRAVLLSGQHIDFPSPQSASDGPRNVNVHVEADAHYGRTRASSSCLVRCSAPSSRNRR